MRLFGVVGLVAAVGLTAGCGGSASPTAAPAPSGSAVAGASAPAQSAGGAPPTSTPASSGAAPAPVTIDAQVAGTDKAPTPGSAAATIATVATEFAVSHDAELRCSTLIDGSLLDDISAFAPDAVSACTRNLSEADREGFPTGLQIRALRVAANGTSATATVTVTGGPLDGATGSWAFGRISGTGLDLHADPNGHWAVVDWGTDYLRSYDQRVLGPGYIGAGPGDPLVDGGVRDCTNHALQAFAGNDYGARFYQQYNYGDDRRYGITLGCVHTAAPADTARLRTAYEFELIETMTHDGNSASVAHCAVERVLAGMDDAAVVRSATDVTGGDAMLKSLNDNIRGCGGTPPTAATSGA